MSEQLPIAEAMAKVAGFMELAERLAELEKHEREAVMLAANQIARSYYED